MIIERLKRNPVATAGVVIGALALTLSLINLSQPAWKLCEVTLTSGQQLRSCECVGARIEVDLASINFFDASKFERMTECKGFIYKIKELEPLAGVAD